MSGKERRATQGKFSLEDQVAMLKYCHPAFPSYRIGFLDPLAKVELGDCGRRYHRRRMVDVTSAVVGALSSAYPGVKFMARRPLVRCPWCGRIEERYFPESRR
jgi:hypothetical protein